MDELTECAGWVEGCDTINDLVTEYRTRVASPPIPLKFELQRMHELGKLLHSLLLGFPSFLYFFSWHSASFLILLPAFMLCVLYFS